MRYPKSPIEVLAWIAVILVLLIVIVKLLEKI